MRTVRSGSPPWTNFALAAASCDGVMGSHTRSALSAAPGPSSRAAETTEQATGITEDVVTQLRAMLARCDGLKGKRYNLLPALI